MVTHPGPWTEESEYKKYALMSRLCLFVIQSYMLFYLNILKTKYSDGRRTALVCCTFVTVTLYA